MRKVLCCTDARRAVVRDSLVVVVRFAIQPCITLPFFFSWNRPKDTRARDYVNPCQTNFLAYSLTKVLPWLQRTLSQQPLALLSQNKKPSIGKVFSLHSGSRKKRQKTILDTIHTWPNAYEVVSWGFWDRNQLLFGCGGATKLVLSRIDPQLFLLFVKILRVATAMDGGCIQPSLYFEHLPHRLFRSGSKKKHRLGWSRTRPFQRYLDCKNTFRTIVHSALFFDAHVSDTDISVYWTTNLQKGGLAFKNLALVLSTFLRRTKSRILLLTDGDVFSYIVFLKMDLQDNWLTVLPKCNGIFEYWQKFQEMFVWHSWSKKGEHVLLMTQTMFLKQGSAGYNFSGTLASDDVKKPTNAWQRGKLVLNKDCVP